MHGNALKGFREAQKVFGSHNVVLFSNNLKANQVFINNVKPNDLYFMSHNASNKKPFCGDLVKEYFKKKNGNLVDSKRVITVGDRLMTDVGLGHALQGLSILVLPWDLENEQTGIKIGRKIEDLIWSKLFNNKLSVHDNELIRKLAEDLSRYYIVSILSVEGRRGLLALEVLFAAPILSFL